MHYIDALNACVCVALMISLVSNLSGWLAKKRDQANIVAGGLEKFYESVNRIVDDPATPTTVVRFLTNLTEIVADPQLSRDAAKFIQEAQKAPDGDKEQTSHMMKDVEELIKTRPDLVENFYAAVAGAVIAIMLRWPSNTSGIGALFSLVTTDPKKEARITSRFVFSKFDGTGNLRAA